MTPTPPPTVLTDPDDIGWWTCCGSTEDVCECMEAEHCPDCDEAWEHCECEREL